MGSYSIWFTSGTVEWLLGDSQAAWLMGLPIDEDEQKDSEKECWWAKSGLFPSASAYNNSSVPVVRRTGENHVQSPDDVEASELRKQYKSLPVDVPLAVRLFYESGGAFHPVDLAMRRVAWSTGAFSSYDEAQNLEVEGRVSFPVILSELSFSDTELRRLWKAFRACKWIDKEFVIVEVFSSEPRAAIRMLESEHETVIVTRLRASWCLSWNVLESIGILMSSGDLIAESSASNLSSTSSLGMVGSQVLELQPRRDLLR